MNEYINSKYDKIMVAWFCGNKYDSSDSKGLKQIIQQVIEDTKKACIHEIAKICIVSPEVDQYSRAVDNAIQKAEVKE